MKKEVSIQNLIEKYLTSNKDKTIISQKKGYRTFSIKGQELNEKIKKTRTFLEKSKIKKGDKIIIIGNNSIEWIVVYFSCILSGITVVPLDITSDKILFKRIQEIVKAKAIFQDKHIQKFSKTKTFYLDELNELTNNLSNTTTKTKINPKDILEIIYTSGSTGKPKGVILTNENITAGINSASSLIKLRLKLKILNLLPLSHIFSQIYGLFLLMYQNNKIYFIDAIQSRKIISFIKNKKINGIIVVPGILEALKKELENKSAIFSLGIQLRLMGVGGASLDRELEKWWKNKLYTIIQGYGLTETSSVVSANELGSTKLGSVGVIANGVKVKLINQEIFVKGRNVTPGYYKNNQQTQESFENGWFKTGDIGEIKNNYLYIKGRKKDIIITASGLNVYPDDIEKILNKVPGVKESCVVEKEKKIHAVLILNKKTNASKIIEIANQKLLSHQKIQAFSVWPYESFPKTPLGKIKKFIVAENLDKLTTKDFQYQDKLFNIINNILKPNKKIDNHSKLSDLGMDSLKRVELITEIEQEFRVEIEETKLNQYTKVSDLGKLMKAGKKDKVKFKTWPMNAISKITRIAIQKIIVYPLTRIFTKTEYYNLDHIKNIKKPVIFVSNHQSIFDVSVINKKLYIKTASAADSNYVFGIGTKNPFLKLYRKLTGSLAALFFNAYPFGESIGTDTSLEFTGEMLDRGYSILIFPEAHRTRDGKIKPFKSGIGYIAISMKVPIIPIKIQGLYDVLPVTKIIPKFHKSSLKIGKPILPKNINNLSYIEATKLIEQRVKSL
ncbi:MAG: AMP-binding protein [Nanoarchaeota archaeon]|nr:AMP-binding protein [Nanoarchaeota archaeon]